MKHSLGRSSFGKFAADIELRKFGHQEYESRFPNVGAFARAALSILAEEEVLAAIQTVSA